MAGETLRAVLELQHREIDARIETYIAQPAGGVNRTASLNQAIAGLRRHIYLEERFLFPALRDAGLIAPVFVMIREHGKMWQTLDRLEPEVEDGAADATALEL